MDVCLGAAPVAKPRGQRHFMEFGFDLQSVVHTITSSGCPIPRRSKIVTESTDFKRGGHSSDFIDLHIGIVDLVDRILALIR